jgi:nucleoside triphosphate pyrophosphatase
VKVVLASQSPRRRELLLRIWGEFEVVPSGVDETLEPGPLAPAVVGLALRKAVAVSRRVGRGVVVAADTVVVIDDEVLGKPAGSAEARAMLTRLRGRQHQVLTAVGLVDAGSGRAVATAVVSRVLMAAYSDAMIGAYVASGSPLDKAGAYAVQDLQGALVDAVVGSYTNVVGLPVEETRRLLAGFGVPVSARTEP